MATAAPRRIAHLTTVDASLRYLLAAQIEASLARGDVVVGISARGSDVAYLEHRGMHFIELEGSTRSMSIRSDLRAARCLWRILIENRPDVLHTHNPKPGIYGRVLGRLARVPRVVHTTHGLFAAPDDPLPKRLAVYMLEGVASRFSHVELVQNPEDFELLHRWRIAPRRKLRLLGNGVDLDRFSPSTDSAREAVRNSLAIARGDLVVGLVARLVAEKGIPELIEAVSLVGSPWRLVLVGPHDAEKKDSLSASELEHARGQGAIILGHRTDVEALYSAMDVFCLPSHREGFPRAAMEAAASGLPVIATDIRGCRQVVDHGTNGLLVPPRDALAIARALRSLGDREVRERMARAARVKAEREFDEQAVVDRVLAAYEP